MSNSVSSPLEVRARTTRRGFIKSFGVAAVVLAGVTTPLLGPIRRAFALPPTWSPIPNQVWNVGVPVNLDLANYCTNPDGSPDVFELSRTLPPGLTLNGSVISGTPTGQYAEKQFTATVDDLLTTTGVEDQPQPTHTQLMASPNPSGGVVRFLGSFPSAAGSAGILRVFAVSGRMVYETPVPMAGSRYEVAWDGRTAGGSRLPSGVYVVMVTVGGETARTRLVLTQ